MAEEQAVQKPRQTYLTLVSDFAHTAKELDLIERNMQLVQTHNEEIDHEGGSASQKITCLDVAMLPEEVGGKTRDFRGETLVADWVLTNPDRAVDGIKKLRDQYGVDIAALTYCDDTLGNPAAREHLNKVRRVAASFVEKGLVVAPFPVVSFIGNCYEEFNDFRRQKGKPMEPAAKRELIGRRLDERIRPDVDSYRGSGVHTVIELCPMRKDGTEQIGGGSSATNYSSNPADLRHVIEVVPEIEICGDFSHLRNYRKRSDGHPSGLAAIAAHVGEFGRRYRMLHLKDGSDNEEGMDNYGGLGDSLSNSGHMAGVNDARLTGRGSILWVPSERLVRFCAPNCSLRSNEVEDFDIPFGTPAGAKTAVGEVARFYGRVIDEVYDAA